MAGRSSADLIDRHNFRKKNVDEDSGTPPINKVVKNLMATSGPELELMTRTNPSLARTALIGAVYADTYGSDFVKKSAEQAERLAVSAGGQGRNDLNEALKAGGALPAEYYTNGEDAREFKYVESPLD